MSEKPLMAIDLKEYRKQLMESVEDRENYTNEELYKMSCDPINKEIEYFIKRAENLFSELKMYGLYHFGEAEFVKAGKLMALLDDVFDDNATDVRIEIYFDRIVMEDNIEVTAYLVDRLPTEELKDIFEEIFGYRPNLPWSVYLDEFENVEYLNRR